VKRLAATLRQRISAIRQRAEALEGKEFEQAMLRLLIGVPSLLYVEWYAIGTSAPNIFWVWYVPAFAFLSFSLLLVALIVLFPRRSVARRVAANVNDVAAISYGLYLTDWLGPPLTALYLFITFGNGFRFGRPYLFLSAALSLVGFATIIALSGYWQRNVVFAAAVALSLLVLPLYVATFIRRLNDAIDHANEANRAKSRFLANMSHELRTPLNGILGMNELLAGTKLSTEQQDYVDTVRTSVHVLLSQVDRVLDISKIEAGKIIIEITDFDVHELIQALARMLYPLADRKNLNFRVFVDPAAPFRLRGDPHHLTEILMNLVSNAIKFTDQGEVLLSVELQPGSDDPVLLRFRVTDTGIGIPPDAIDRIFDSFTQADQSTTRKYGGSGLGTTIAKQLVELMGGTIGVDSVLGNGSTFWCDIPFRLQAADVDSVTLPGMRVLVVADRGVATADDVLQTLDRWGTSKIVLSQPSDALTQLDAQAPEHAFHALVVAKDMVDIDLRSFLTRATHHPFRRRPAIVLVAGRWPSTVRDDLVQSGASAVIEWPAHKPLLLAALHAAPLYAPIRTTPAPTPDQAPARSYTILVAEDNLTNQKLLQKILERAGHRIDIVPDGETAVDRIAGKRYDVAILDMSMPNMSGLDVVKLHRFTQPTSALPFIILTADVTPETRRECEAAKVNGFLTKPINPKELLRTITAVVNAPAAADSLPIAAVNNAPAKESPYLDPGTLRELEGYTSGADDFAAILATFVSDSHQLLAQLELALNASSPQQFRDAAHAFKGMASTLGALRLAELCKSAEALEPSRFQDNAAHTLARLRECYDATAHALEKHLGSKGGRLIH